MTLSLSVSGCGVLLINQFDAKNAMLNQEGPDVLLLKQTVAYMPWISENYCVAIMYNKMLFSKNCNNLTQYFMHHSLYLVQIRHYILQTSKSTSLLNSVSYGGSFLSQNKHILKSILRLFIKQFSLFLVVASLYLTIFTFSWELWVYISFELRYKQGKFCGRNKLPYFQDHWREKRKTLFPVLQRSSVQLRRMWNGPSSWVSMRLCEK